MYYIILSLSKHFKNIKEIKGTISRINAFHPCTVYKLYSYTHSWCCKYKQISFAFFYNYLYMWYIFKNEKTFLQNRLLKLNYFINYHNEIKLYTQQVIYFKNLSVILYYSLTFINYKSYNWMRKTCISQIQSEKLFRIVNFR